jgi:exodeoxyribonuclease VII small subunit
VIRIADCQFGDCRLPISNCQLKCNKSWVRLFDYQFGNWQLAITPLAPATSLAYIARSMAKKTQSPPKSFEDALAELEQILSAIEGGQVGLEESLVKYERGTFLIQHCRGVLNTAEKQIEVLTATSESGVETSTPISNEPPP